MQTPSDRPDGLDFQKHFIRVVHEHGNGMVEFEFAIGEPQLYVEMAMPLTAFEDFCFRQKVVPTRGGLADAPTGSQEHEWDWSLRTARERHFRYED